MPGCHVVRHCHVQRGQAFCPRSENATITACESIRSKVFVLPSVHCSPCMSIHRCSTSASIASLREYTCVTRVRVASNSCNECDVHSFAAHCLRFRLFTAAHAARPSLQYICVHLFAARMHSRRRVWVVIDACAKPSLSKSPVKRRT